MLNRSNEHFAARAAEWLAEADATQARMRANAGEGLLDPTRISGLTGLEIMQALRNGKLPFPPMAETLDVVLIEVGEGRAVFQGRPLRRHYNPFGVVHGGWYATLLDFALGCAVQTTLPAGKAYSTGQLGVHIVRPATEASGPLRAVGTALHSGRQMATSEARIVDAAGRLYAHATTTCIVFDAGAR